MHSVVNDIHGAQVLGMKGILVKTDIGNMGKYQERDEESINPPPHSLTDYF